jgi:hypothetical protein
MQLWRVRHLHPAHDLPHAPPLDLNGKTLLVQEANCRIARK